MPVYFPGLTFGGLGYGGASYGYSPYGSGVHPRLPVPVDGGYGGASYGFASYGSVDILPPRVTGAQSLDGYRVEVFFSEAMLDDASLVDSASYTFTDSFGVPLTTASVVGGTPGTVGGFTSVIVTHSGSTLGGQYTVTVVGPTDFALNPVGPPPTNSAVFLGLGDPASLKVGLASPDDGRTVALEFLSTTVAGSLPLLDEASFSPGVEDTSSYEITTTYPVPPLLTSATQDPADLSKVALEVTSMTSALYTLTAGPSTAFGYTGTVLPDDDPGFTGVEQGTGASTPSIANGLILSKSIGVTYGWSFTDTSGRMKPDTTYRADFRYDLSATVVLPVMLNSTLGVFSASDGAFQIDVSMEDVGGIKFLTISSGFTSTVALAWDTAGEHKISVIRNQKGDFYTILFDEIPVHTFAAADAVGPPSLWGAGTAFVLGMDHEVGGFQVRGMGLTASETLFTHAWNFLHGLVGSFTGSALLTQDRLKTRYGPLVRGWGDATPASVADVEVRLNGTALEVGAVNPYVGEIYPVIPIPLAPPPAEAIGSIDVGPLQPAAGVCQITVNGVTLQEGAATGWVNDALPTAIAATAAAIATAITTFCGVSAEAVGTVVQISALTTGVAGNTIGLANTSGDANIVVSGSFLTGGVDGLAVDTDYIWFATPAMELVGLNTRGLTLNTWDRSVGHTAGVPAPLPPEHAGGSMTNRFPMGVALGPYSRPSPKHIGHRYIGFQKDYSALLNQPTTMLLNSNPHAISVGGLSAEALNQRGVFDGNSSPLVAPTPWVLKGVDSGGSVADGIYYLGDASAGPFGIGTAAFYARDTNLSLSTNVMESGRFRVATYTADGVFTGVGVGLHDGAHLVLVGALVVDGVQHVGLLKDGNVAHLEEGWHIGPQTAATAHSSTVLHVSFADLPSGVASGGRFRIATGSQAGVYTIAECGLRLVETTGVVEITLTPALPAPLDLEGNTSFNLLFETLWEKELISFRIYSAFPTGSAQVYLGGAISGLVADVAEVASFPAQTALLLPATEEGVVFWGSVSRRAESGSFWDLVQYANNPLQLVQTAQGITAFTEMGELPPADPNDPWYEVGGFGYAEVDALGDQILLKSTSASDTIDVGFSYERVEPFLTPTVRTDAEATFKVESGVLGAGDAALRVGDGEREVQLKTLLIVQHPAKGNTLLPSLPSVSLSGLQTPPDAGWSSSVLNAVDPYVRGQTLEFSKAADDTATWSSSIAAAPSSSWGVAPTGMILEARFALSSGTVGADGSVGILFSGSLPLPSSNYERTIGLTLGAATVDLRDRDGIIVQSFGVAWDDKKAHDYRVLADPVADIVVLVVDDVIIGSTPLTGFSQGFASAIVLTQTWAFTGDGVCAGVLHSCSVASLRAEALLGTTLLRTFGLLLYGGDPDTLDSYRVPRTDSSGVPNSVPGAVFEEMDWRDFCRVRIYLDPTWGVSFYRPDLALPPWATGDFVTETTDPTAAWAVVEYAELPTDSTAHGGVSFGSLDSRSISQQRWDSVRYRIRGGVEGFGIAPQGMVLNRAFTLTSGEYNLDTTLEVVTVPSRSPYAVYIPDSAMYADRVFVVQVDGAVVSSTLWTFDAASQILSFDVSAPLPSDQHQVTVTFAPGRPVTQTYLCSQPLSGSVTLLNEGTPPVPSSRDENTLREVEAGSIINDPDDVLDEAESLILNDPSRVVVFSDPSDALYADLQFCEVSDGESVHITSICDGPGPGLGLSALEIEGRLTSDTHTVPEGPAGPWGGSSAVFKGSATHFNPSTVLTASGGFILGGNLGPGTAILYPNQRGPSGEPPAGGMGINQDFALRLEDVTAREDTFDIPTLLNDDVPPTSADPTVDPNVSNPGAGGANGHGAAAYTMTDYGPRAYLEIGGAALTAGDTIEFVVPSGLVLTAVAGAAGANQFDISSGVAPTIASNIQSAIAATALPVEATVTNTTVTVAPTVAAAADRFEVVAKVTNTGAIVVTLTASRLGPWGGLTSLTSQSLLAGGAQLNGDEFILGGGQQIPGPVITTGYIQAAL